jgi:hypothetical protein
LAAVARQQSLPRPWRSLSAAGTPASRAPAFGDGQPDWLASPPRRHLPWSDPFEPPPSCQVDRM